MKPRSLLSALALLLLVSGCGGPAVLRRPAEKASAVRTGSELSSSELGPKMVEFLRSDRRKGQMAELATAIVRQQLRRATQLFAMGERAAGVAAVRGALFLIRADEMRPEMWIGAEDALFIAADEASRLGNEGQARALYALLKASKPSIQVVAAADEHLSAMDQFSKFTGSDRPLEHLGEKKRVAVERALYEPTNETWQGAATKTVDWIRAGFTSDALERWGEASYDRQEASEAYDARRKGVLTLVALYLRHGDAMGSLDQLEKADMGRLVPQELRKRLEEAGEDDDMTAWGQLYQFFQGEADPNRAESIGTDLAMSASLGSATELYRSHPKDFMAVGPLALILSSMQFGDPVPGMLVDALGKRPTREEVSFALSLILRAILVHGEVAEMDTVRRIFASSEPIFARAKELLRRGEPLRPHPARLYRAMTTLESRAADLGRAKAMLEQSLALESSASGFVDLSSIERQRGNFELALDALSKAREQAKTSDDTLGAVDALTVRYELLLERDDRAGAEQALRAALDAALGARDRAQRPSEQSQAERRLARVLELYEQQDGAERALRRAMQSARTDAKLLSVTVLDAGRRALVASDLRALRALVRDAQEYRLRGEDCTYLALWLRILERRRQIPSDGTVEELVSRLGELDYWPAKLRAWLLGQLSDSELDKAARRDTEHVESRFYRALFASSERESAGLSKELGEIAKSPAVGLVEVSVAQDMQRRERHLTSPAWPQGVAVP